MPGDIISGEKRIVAGDDKILRRRESKRIPLMNDDGDGTGEKNPRRRALRPRGARVSDLSRAFGFRAAERWIETAGWKVRVVRECRLLLVVNARRRMFSLLLKATTCS